MESTAQQFDVVVIGAGPSGCCAALRLKEMGHRVAIVEKYAFPRAQIGESLSPGIHNIFDYLGAGALLSDQRYLVDLPSSVAWDSQEPISFQRKGHLLVDRALLDQQLLDHAKSRGIQVFQPALLKTKTWKGNRWELSIQLDQEYLKLDAIYVLDATGRMVGANQDRIPYRAANVALWVEIPASGLDRRTLVEARPEGWFWASPIAGDRFRIMLFLSPAILKVQAKKAVFHQLLRESKLLAALEPFIENAVMNTCLAAHYVHASPWKDQLIQLGESAFTLDPISSSGMEKAMRFSLQTAIALNTALTGNPELGRAYYENKLMETVSEHCSWTDHFYSTAWPAAQGSFWKDHADFKHQAALSNDFYETFKSYLNTHKQMRQQQELAKKEVRSIITVEQIWPKAIMVSPEVSFRKLPCIVADRLVLKEAVAHPELQKEIAFIGEVEISPLLLGIGHQQVFGDMVNSWSLRMPVEKAVHIGLSLMNAGILCEARKGHKMYK